MVDAGCDFDTFVASSVQTKTEKNDRHKAEEIFVCNVIRLPATLKITIIIKYAYYKKEKKKIHSHTYRNQNKV